MPKKKAVYCCKGCGGYIDEADVDAVGGHCRAVDDGHGNPMPEHCGPCILVEEVGDDD